MPSNDERRQVAARLRNLDEQVLDCREYEHRAICAVVGCWGDGEYSNMELKDRLADLIEPEERTCRMEFSERKRGVYCSHCGERMDIYTCDQYGDGTIGYSYPFCYKCGAKVVD